MDSPISQPLEKMNNPYSPATTFGPKPFWSRDQGAGVKRSLGCQWYAGLDQITFKPYLEQIIFLLNMKSYKQSSLAGAESFRLLLRIQGLYKWNFCSF